MEKQIITKVALDLDGVLANFCKAAANKMGKVYPEEPFQIPNNWLDDENNTLWKCCRGHDFWAQIEPFPWAQDILKIVRENCEDWKLVTKPSFDPGSYSGKFEWVRNNIKDGIRRLWLINGSKAYACTGPHHLLIDDNDKNCEEWEKAGGTVFKWKEISENWPQYDVATRLEELKSIF
jgi:hypothetical protein